MKSEYEALKKEIGYHSHRYYVLDNPEITDAEYDKMMRRLIEIEKEKLQQEKTQFEAYKDLEISRLNQAKEQFEGEKKQFEKYKEISVKKIELDSNTLEQKCLKFKELMSQFNSNFKTGFDIEE